MCKCAQVHTLWEGALSREALETSAECVYVCVRAPRPSGPSQPEDPSGTRSTSTRKGTTHCHFRNICLIILASDLEN